MEKTNFMEKDNKNNLLHANGTMKKFITTTIAVAKH